MPTRSTEPTLTLREIASSMAIREAAQTIERGHADLMIAGATGTRIHSFKTIHPSGKRRYVVSDVVSEIGGTNYR